MVCKHCSGHEQIATDPSYLEHVIQDDSKMLCRQQNGHLYDTHAIATCWAAFLMLRGSLEIHWLPLLPVCTARTPVSARSYFGNVMHSLPGLLPITIHHSSAVRVSGKLVNLIWHTISCDDGCGLHLLSRGLGKPLRAFIKAGAGLVEAAASSHITDGQVARAAVNLIITASGLRQRAASPGEAVAKVLAHAAACASCNITHRSISRRQ